MIRRRVVNGQVFVRVRRGWRLVKNGYIRTRRGWRKLRPRPGRRRRQPSRVPVIEAPSAAAPQIPPLPRRLQWRGKYNALLPVPQHEAAEAGAPAVNEGV